MKLRARTRSCGLVIGCLVAVSGLAVAAPNPGAGPVAENLPQDLHSVLLMQLEFSHDYGDLTPDWRKELSFDPGHTTATVRLRWRHVGASFTNAALHVFSATDQFMGEQPIPVTPTGGDGWRYTQLAFGDLLLGQPAVQPPFTARLVAQDEDGQAFGMPSNEVLIAPLEPPDPFLYTPLYIWGVMQDMGVPGLAGSVWCPDTESDRKWFAGTRRHDGAAGPIQGNDLWHIGSCTKALTATLIGLMIQYGYTLPGSSPSEALDWDTPISAVFADGPWYGDIHPRFHDTTIRHLACHRSGMQMTEEEDDETRVVGSGTKNEDPMAFRLEMTETLLTRQHMEVTGSLEEGLVTIEPTVPGTKWFYGHGNYLILGAVVEKLTTVPYEQAIAALLLNPLDMTTAQFGMPVDVSPYQPHGHYRKTNFPHEVVRDNLKLPPVWNPAGGLYCSQEDWLKFCRLHLYGAEGIVVLNPDTLMELHTPHPQDYPDADPDDTNPSYGWGWGIMSEPGGYALSHDGSYGRFYARHTVHRGYGFAAVSASNMDGTTNNPSGMQAVGLLHNHLIEKSIEKATEFEQSFGTIDGGSGGSTGILSFPKVQFDPYTEDATSYAEEVWPGVPVFMISLADHDTFNRMQAIEARRPNLLEWHRLDDLILEGRFNSESDYFYVLERRDQMDGENRWATMDTLVGEGDVTSFEITLPGGHDTGFYRVRDDPQ